MTKEAKRKFRHVANYHPTGGEKNDGISLTVPDQNLTVRQIMQDMINGIDHSITQRVIYSEDMPDYRKLDISELAEQAEIVNDDINYLKQKGHEETVAARKKREEKREISTEGGDNSDQSNPKTA